MPFDDVEKRRAYQKARYHSDPDKGVNRMREWRALNPGRAKEIAGKKVSPEKNREAQRAYRARLKERQSNDPVWQESKRMRKEAKALERALVSKLEPLTPLERAIYYRMWRLENPGKVNALRAKRRASELRATPEWADLEAIEEIYKQCRDVTNLVGEPYHVDHIVPLNSKLVCGLHNQFNLQIIPGEENIKKSNRHWPDMP
jgi:hypothetical protein